MPGTMYLAGGDIRAAVAVWAVDRTFDRLVRPVHDAPGLREGNVERIAYRPMQPTTPALLQCGCRDQRRLSWEVVVAAR